MNAAVLDPRAASAAAIARSAMPWDPYGTGASPDPQTVKDLARNRFGLDLTDTQITTAIRAATPR